ncbi:MAG: type II secretion system protein [Desulfobacteraceae bacterium]|jgi:prepilin-type N-terminal cleavage/methylation domain-containing protein|nr:type II secretion system protein [Desulfobacteraceae bacterium]
MFCSTKGLKMLSEKEGFTLVEIIVTLTLVGIMAVVGGMGIITGMKGYVYTMENVAITQNARLAMARISKEISELTYIDTTSGTDCIRYKIETVSNNYRKIRPKSEELNLNVASGDDCDCDPSIDTGDILALQVENFKLTYQAYNGSELTPPINSNDLYAVNVEFTFTRNDDNPDNKFEMTVNTKNN